MNFAPAQATDTMNPPLVLSPLALCLLAATCVAAPPKVNYLFPAGSSRGQSVMLKAAGEFATWPPQVWCEQPGLTFVAETDKGKFRVTVAAEAAPGVVWLRFFDGDGASSLRPFIVGTLPEVDEVEPNDAPEKPQSVVLNTVVNGQLVKSGDVDGFAVELKRGEVLTAAVQANSLLGSPMDCVLQICQLVERGDSASGPTTPEAYVLEQNHDAIGLDPLLTLTAPRDGKYLVRLFGFPSAPDSTIGFAGNENLVYRLTLTTSEYDAARTLPPPPAPYPAVLRNADAQPQPIALPCVVTGTLATPRAEHTFQFSATKDKKITFHPESHSLGLLTEPMLRVADASGKSIAETELSEPNKEVELTFTPPADGTFTLVLRDLYRRGGPRLHYRLIAALQQPDFRLSLAMDTFELSADKPLEIPITIDRRWGFDEPIEILALGLPPGVIAEPVTSAPTGDTAKGVKLVLKSTGETPLSSQPFRVQGQSGGATKMTGNAQFVTPLPLDQKHDSLWLTVRK